MRSWCNDEGWGVIDSRDTPGGCWVRESPYSGAEAFAGTLVVTFDDDPAPR